MRTDSRCKAGGFVREDLGDVEPDALAGDPCQRALHVVCNRLARAVVFRLLAEMEWKG